LSTASSCFSLRTYLDEGLITGQADAVARWQETMTGIAIEEMLHLALVMNVMTAIGAAPSLARPSFPRHSEFLPPGAEFALLPFGVDALTHFLYLERPEGMERVDATEFVPAARRPRPPGQAEVMPRVQGFPGRVRHHGGRPETLGTALTRLPMGPGNPDRTAGAAFQMYYQMGNFEEWRNAAWVLLAERAAVLSRQCAECATRDGVPEAVGSAATTAAAISEQLAGHLPEDLRPA
jgi:hypothetical protein